MYLFHNTSILSLISILNDGYLKSISLLKKEGYKNALNEAYGLYKTNKFIYFSCTDKLFSRKIYSEVILYFNSKLLFNRKFFIANFHTDAPDNLYELKGNYKRKYNKYYQKYNAVLKKLFNYSISRLKNGDSFQVFQQIAILNKINIKELVGIEFTVNVDSSIINNIQTNFPNVKILIKPRQ